MLPLRSLSSLTKGDLITLGTIVQAEMPMMGTKDIIAEHINTRLQEMQATQGPTREAPQRLPRKAQQKPPAEDDDMHSVRSVASVSPLTTADSFNIVITGIFDPTAQSSKGVRKTSERTFRVHAGLEVRELKSMIYAATTYTSDVRLIFRDADLEDDRTIGSYPRIVANSVIRLLEAKLRGGSDDPDASGSMDKGGKGDGSGDPDKGGEAKTITFRELLKLDTLRRMLHDCSLVASGRVSFLGRLRIISYFFEKLLRMMPPPAASPS